MRVVPSFLPSFLSGALYLAISVAGQAQAGVDQTPTILIPRVMTPEPVEALRERGAPDFVLRHATLASEVELDIGALRVRPDSMRPGWTDRFVTGQTIELHLVDGSRIEAVGARVEDAIDGASTWIGKVKGDHGYVTITVAGRSLFGTIERGMQRYTLSSSADGRVFLALVDQQSFGKCLTGESRVTEAKPKSPNRGFAKPGAMPKSVPSSRTIDLMVLYDDDLGSTYGDPAATINNLIANANQSFIDSGISAALRVVHYGAVSGGPSPESATDFTNALTALSGSTGVFSNVATLRAAHDADLVTYLFENTSSRDFCGLANILSDNFSNGTTVNEAFSVSSISCAAGDLTVTHEIGHTLGGEHEGGIEGPYNFTHGYTNDDSDFRTIMGSLNHSGSNCTIAGCSRVNRWSDPDSTLYGGVPLSILGDVNSNMKDALDGASGVLSTVEAVVDHMTPNASTPGQPSSISAYSCFSTHDVNWGTASGTVGWYELYKSTSSMFTTQDLVYRGSSTGTTLVAGSTTYLRVRACNSNACGSYRSGLSVTNNGTCP